jgi:hypothetical protein
MSFRWYYPDQVRPVFLRTTTCYGTLNWPLLSWDEGRSENGNHSMLPNTRLLH